MIQHRNHSQKVKSRIARIMAAVGRKTREGDNFYEHVKEFETKNRKKATKDDIKGLACSLLIGC